MAKAAPAVLPVKTLTNPATARNRPASKPLAVLNLGRSGVTGAPLVMSRRAPRRSGHGGKADRRRRSLRPGSARWLVLPPGVTGRGAGPGAIRHVPSGQFAPRAARPGISPAGPG